MTKVFALIALVITTLTPMFFLVAWVATSDQEMRTDLKNLRVPRLLIVTVFALNWWLVMPMALLIARRGEPRSRK